MGASISTSRPVSSRVSRSAVSSSVSPESGVPFGSAQSRELRRWTRATSRWPSTGRTTTPPAEVARAVRWTGKVAPLRAAAARNPEGKGGAPCRQTPRAPDRRKPETARLGAQRPDGGRCRAAPWPVIDRGDGPQAQPRAVSRASGRAEMDGRMSDETGHETHAHGPHCTPVRGRRKPHAQGGEGRYGAVRK